MSKQIKLTALGVPSSHRKDDDFITDKPKAKKAKTEEPKLLRNEENMMLFVRSKEGMKRYIITHETNLSKEEFKIIHEVGNNGGVLRRNEEALQTFTEMCKPDGCLHPLEDKLSTRYTYCKVVYVIYLDEGLDGAAETSQNAPLAVELDAGKWEYSGHRNF